MLIEIITTALVAAFVTLLIVPIPMGPIDAPRDHPPRDRPDAADSLDATAALVARLKERFDAEEVAW